MSTTTTIAARTLRLPRRLPRPLPLSGATTAPIRAWDAPGPHHRPDRPGDIVAPARACDAPRSPALPSRLGALVTPTRAGGAPRSCSPLSLLKRERPLVRAPRTPNSRSLLSQLITVLALAGLAAPVAAQDATQRRIDRLLARAPVIDGHNDLPWELRDKQGGKVEGTDLAADTSALPHPLQTDIPRLRKGGVGAQFWSVWIPADTIGPRAVEMTLEEIDIVRRMVAANPAAFAMATTAADIRRIMKGGANGGRIASLIGVEGGHQIDGRLAVLRQYKALGVGYMTLTHGKSLSWADSSTDAPRANGLSDFGRQVVAEMNRIGMIVDVSHVSDATMRAALAATKAPVMASHSGARAIADAPRNIPDDLLAAIGANGGVVMVNFYPSFVSPAWRAWDQARTAEAKRLGVPADAYDAKAPGPLLAWDRAHPEPRVDAASVADHVDHVARVAGHDHVGLGGDYDGIGGTGPVGMKGVDGYPLLLAELARRGWSDTDLAKLTSGNILRVMERVEAVAASMKDVPPGDAVDVASR